MAVDNTELYFSNQYETKMINITLKKEQTLYI